MLCLAGTEVFQTQFDFFLYDIRFLIDMFFAYFTITRRHKTTTKCYKIWYFCGNDKCGYD